MPSRLAVVGVDEQQRGKAGVGGVGAKEGNADISIAPVSSPGDLTGLGIKLSQCLSAWESATQPTIVAVDSLTTLLQFADLERVFRFVHVLAGRVANADAVGYFHLDPAAHDERAAATLQGPLDVVYEHGNGGWQQR
ncbi:hypothetical protein [Halosegnis sp.]|uniref:DUF7504 family protein n=1 Tax=Halosegnis sp. TaxID=2864959 RepID=UPI0035D4AB0E